MPTAKSLTPTKSAAPIKSAAPTKSGAATQAAAPAISAAVTEAAVPILVPQPEPGSYNAKRPAGKLLQSQTLHLREALIKHMADLAAVLEIDPRSLKTEGEVSTYIRRATAILHTHHARAARK